jgi:hypothetical protein
MSKTFNDEYKGISPEHDWSVDEKGCQVGGGRKDRETIQNLSSRKAIENAMVFTVII